MGRRGRLRWAADSLAFVLVLAAYALAFIGWNLPATLLRLCLPRRRGERLGQAMISWSFRRLLGLMRVLGLAEFDLAALDALRGDAGIVIAGNHPTLIDAVLVISRLPRVVCVCKASLWDNPALGAGARLAGYIRNDAPHRVVRRAAEAVEAGSQLLIFPEGTRTRSPPVDGFKGGFAVMARQAGAPVQCVLIEASSPYLRKGWPLHRRPDFPLHYRVRLGRRFTVDTGAEAFAAGLEAYVRGELAG